MLRLGAIAAALLISGTAALAAPALPVDANAILAAHNRYRAEVGVPPLRWSEELARGAQLWAEEIAALSRMEHSGTSGVGENLAMWWSTGAQTPVAQLVGLWGREKRAFVHGAFPDVSRDGNWKTVGHYTQMVWRATTEVGCGAAANGTSEFLVCWYSPQGNFIGQRPY